MEPLHGGAQPQLHAANRMSLRVNVRAVRAKRPFCPEMLAAGVKAAMLPALAFVMSYLVCC